MIHIPFKIIIFPSHKTSLSRTIGISLLNWLSVLWRKSIYFSSSGDKNQCKYFAVVFTVVDELEDVVGALVPCV